MNQQPITLVSNSEQCWTVRPLTLTVAVVNTLEMLTVRRANSTAGDGTVIHALVSVSQIVKQQYFAVGDFRQAGGINPNDFIYLSKAKDTTNVFLQLVFASFF